MPKSMLSKNTLIEAIEPTTHCKSSIDLPLPHKSSLLHPRRAWPGRNRSNKSFETSYTNLFFLLARIRIDLSGSLLALRARPKEIGEAGHVDSLTVVDDDVEAQRTHVTAQFRLTQLLLVSAVVGWREEI